MNMIQQKRSLVVVVFGVIVSVLFFLSPVGAEGPGVENLLQNPSFEEGSGQKVPGWSFYRGKPEGTLNGGISTDAAEGKQSISIQFVDGGGQSWWVQEVPVRAQSKYTVSVSAKADFEEGSDYYIFVVCYFKDADGKWISWVRAIEIGQDQKQWPAARKVPPSDWKRFSTTVTTPPGTKTMGVKFNLGCRDGATVTAWCDDFSVTPVASQQTAIEDAPSQVDVLMQEESLPLGATWDIEKAVWEKNGAREKVCINGLWRFQPEFDYGQPPKQSQWGYLRVPGVWIDPWGRIIFEYHGAEKLGWYKEMMDYRRTGFQAQKWEGKDLSRFSIGWYERMVRIPEDWRSRRVYVDFTIIDEAATVYLNGEPVGEVGLPGGRVVLPEDRIRYGGLNAVTVRVVGSGYPGRYTYLLRAGWGSGLCGDVFLCAEPRDVNLSEVFIMPSVREENLSVEAKLETKTQNNIRFRTVVRDKSGQVVEEYLSGPETFPAGSNDVRLTISWKAKHLWSPSSPYLYRLELSAIGDGGKLLDKVLPVEFGFREFWIDGRWFYLNGHKFRLRPYLFNGGAYGCDLTDKAVRRTLVFHKTMGFNAVELRGTYRLPGEGVSYYDEFLRQADRLGMVVLWQLESVAREEQYRGFDNPTIWEEYRSRALEGPIVRLRNHPSIFMWSPSMNFNGNRREAAPWLLGKEPDMTARDPQATAAQEMACAAIKELDPTRPTFLHDALNLGEVANANYHFNLPPLQERVEYPSEWAANGTKPLMMVEAADCFMGNFQKNRSGAGSTNGEPLATEYIAMYLGPEAYREETESYVKWTGEDYQGNGKWPEGRMFAEIKGLPGYRDLAVLFTEQTRRAWRTWGVPGGLLPWYCLGYEENYGGTPPKRALEVSQDGAANLQSPGLRVDRWDRGYSRHENPYTYPGLPEEYPSTFQDANYIYRAMRRVNMPLMIYLGGGSGRFTARDHGYFAGETVEKQVVAVWDGADRRKLTAKWRVITAEGEEIASGQEELNLEPGEIKKVPIGFKVPKVDGVKRATVELETFEDGNLLDYSWCRDRFGVEFYPRSGPVHSNARVLVYDPEGLTSEWLGKTGLDFNNLDTASLHSPEVLKRRLEGADLLIIGRQCLSRSLLPACEESIRGGLSVIVFEQKAEVLKSLGFRTLDIGSRYSFATSGSSPFLKGIPQEGLCNWRGSSTLVDPYPMTLEPPAGEVQPYRWGNYGTVSTVVIEKPHFGTFTPVLDAEFDLRYSPLLLWRLGRGRVLFCQMDITGRYGKEPAATLLAKNILKQMQGSGVTSEPGVALAIGDRAFNLLQKAGLDVEEFAGVNALDRKPENSVVVIGDDISVDDLGQYRDKLAQFVERGGQVLCLSMDSGQLQQVVPFEVKVQRDRLSRTEMGSQSVQKPLFDGLSISDLHYRSFVEADVITGLSSGSTSDTEGCLAAVSYGKGRYVFCQVGPWDVSPEKQYANAHGKKVSADFLRYSQWHVYRMLSQILTNMGVGMEPGRTDVLVEGPGWKVDLSGMWKAHYSPPDDLSRQRVAYTQGNFDDSGWTLIRAPGGVWPHQGKEELFSHRAPADKSGSYSIWYRKTVKVPAELEGKDLQLCLGVIDDADETYVNGVKVGGISRENSDNYWQEERVYNVPADIVNYGQENVIAFRMTDYQGGWGGFTRGPSMYLTVAGRGDTSLYAEPLKIDDNPYRVYWW